MTSSPDTILGYTFDEAFNEHYMAQLTGELLSDVQKVALTAKDPPPELAQIENARREVRCKEDKLQDILNQFYEKYKEENSLEG